MNCEKSLSLINRDNLNYLSCIEQYFLSLIKKGVSLSPLDYQIIRSWEKRGIPLSIACSGIKRGIESFIKANGPYKPLPRSIKYCEIPVENEFINYKRIKIGTHLREEEGIDERKTLLEKLNVLISKIGNVIESEKDEDMKRLYTTVYNKVQKLGSSIDKNSLFIHSKIEEIDRYFMFEFYKLMCEEELRHLQGETKEKLSLLKIRMSKEAYEKTLESLINIDAKKRYGLLEISIGE
ncbi:MAG: hypothetical protein SWO11_03540 [Thermodesulfobacteriota bacterium]|nr:hypothetical protein [Thermodesulfobacteriota bacterium]